jgi:tetratricopeptide (TPR) repeat protein
MPARRLLLLLLFLTPWTVSGQLSGLGIEAAWEAMAHGQFPEAHRLFAAERQLRPADREVRLGEALSLLELQPRTHARIRRGAELLDELLEEDSGDEIGARARYFRARLEHVHRLSPDPASSVPHYERLIEAHPDHPLAGQALAKLALVKLYREQPAAELKAAFAELDQRSAGVADPAARRDLHLILAEASLRLQLGEEEALRHFLAAMGAGVLLRPVLADTLARIGELAAQLGEIGLARAHYGRFLAEFPRDPRWLLIAERMAALPVPDEP